MANYLNVLVVFHFLGNTPDLFTDSHTTVLQTNGRRYTAHEIAWLDGILGFLSILDVHVYLRVF